MKTGFCKGFNPRAREGRDIDELIRAARVFVSIHAPARGATFGDAPVNAPGAFQSTRPRGARRDKTSASIYHLSFNPRAREGRDEAFVQDLHEVSFQSTRPRGARQERD